MKFDNEIYSDLKRIVRPLKKWSIFFFLTLIHLGINAQWTQLGSDIDGDLPNDWSGDDVSLSADGSTMAVGFSGLNAGSSTGYVRTYTFNDLEWIQQGEDIMGEAIEDGFGCSVSLSAEGTILAVGGCYNDGNGDGAGHVRIFEFDGTAWIQLGEDIDGQAANDQSGHAIDLNSDGSIISIGSKYNSEIFFGSGHVRVFAYDGTDWIQQGQNIAGEAENDVSGESVSLSADGSILAIGAILNGDFVGHVRVYEFIDEEWIQLGDDIDGDQTEDYFGSVVSLNSDGSILAISAIGNDANGNNSGQVKVFSYIESSWQQTGQDIVGEAVNDLLGRDVSLSEDGLTLAIGSPGAESTSGVVKVYTYDGTDWIQNGLDIVGESEEDRSGYSVSISADGSIVAVGAPFNDGNGDSAGHVRVFSNESETSILENSFGDSFIISPNPTNDKVTINFGDEPVSSIAIINELGQEILTMKEDFRSQRVISLVDFSIGIYFVEVMSGDQVRVLKLVKE